MGLMIVLGGGYNKSRCVCDVHIKDMGPLDFLNCIKFAEVVVSTSFHATAFCHIFHKEFVTILPQKNGERINSLLNQTGLPNRGVYDFMDKDILQKKINWNDVDERLFEYIQASKLYLDESLSK